MENFQKRNWDMTQLAYASNNEIGEWSRGACWTDKVGRGERNEVCPMLPVFFTVLHPVLFAVVAQW